MFANPRFDADLLRRYDRPGPRYTSYPTAPQFSSAFGEEALRAAAPASNGDPIPRRLSLYVHVPFCMSPCFYCGCNRIITRDLARGETYLVRLYREIALAAELFDRDREVIQLHLGGGTPNFLSPAQLRELVDTLRSHFRFSDSPQRDLSIELDPRFTNPADIAELGRIGFNRASFGVQDFDPVVQKAVNRIQSVEETRAVVDACRAAGFRSVNIDLIYGLPKQNVEGFSKTLDTVLEMRPDRLAVYSYAHLPDLFKAQKQIDAADLPDPATKLSLLQLATSTSAWTTSPCPTTTSPRRSSAARCTGTSWATPPTPTATCSASASAPSATSATASARTRATCPAGRSRWTRAACRCSAACAWTRTTCCAPN